MLRKNTYRSGTEPASKCNEALAYDASSRGAITAESVKSKESSYLQTSRGTINSLLSKLTWIVVLGARVVSVPAIT